jgi:hypothetical protein
MAMAMAMAMAMIEAQSLHVPPAAFSFIPSMFETLEGEIRSRPYIRVF